MDPSPFHEQIASLESALGDARAKLRTVIAQRRNYVAIGVMLLGLPLAAATSISAMPGWVSVTGGILGFLLLIAAFGSDPTEAQGQLEKIESMRRLYFSLFNIRQDEAYFDRLVKINVENLAEYYTLVKIHTQQSFRLSSGVAVIGFVLIVVGLTGQYLGNVPKDAAYIATIAGTLVEVISGLFFYLYSKTVRQLKGYHDSLLDVQNILLSFKLIEGTGDEREKAGMTLKMIEFLAARRLPHSA